MIGDYVKKQGQDDQKLHENRQLALFWNTPAACGGGPLFGELCE
jgi:hypothetical protein